MKEMYQELQKEMQHESENQERQQMQQTPQRTVPRNPVARTDCAIGEYYTERENLVKSPEETRRIERATAAPRRLQRITASNECK